MTAEDREILQAMTDLNLVTISSKEHEEIPNANMTKMLTMQICISEIALASTEDAEYLLMVFKEMFKNAYAYATREVAARYKGVDA